MANSSFRLSCLTCAFGRCIKLHQKDPAGHALTGMSKAPDNYTTGKTLFLSFGRRPGILNA